MKTLKAKLFFSVGAILLFVSIFNIILSEIWIKKALDRKGGIISDHVKVVDNKIKSFASFLLTLRMVEEATDLERIAYGVSSLEDRNPDFSLWQLGQEIVSNNPEIAFVQMQKEGNIPVTIFSKGVPLRPFSFAKGKNGNLWVQVLGSTELFAAIPVEKQTGSYLLFSEKNISLDTKDPFYSHLKSIWKEKGILSDFQNVEMRKIPYSITDSPVKVFNALLNNENEWLYRMDLIHALLPWWEEPKTIQPIGAVKIDPSGAGGFLWSSEVFPVVKQIQNRAVPGEDLFLFLREVNDEKDLDVARKVSLDRGIEACFGFSVSQSLQEVALLSGKLLLVAGKDISIGIRPDGTIFDVAREEEVFTQNSGIVSWRGNPYQAFVIDFSLFSLYVLTPESETLAVNRFLEQLGQELVITVSISLSIAALVSFIIALILLRNISIKITEPIKILSDAAAHLGMGTYEGIILPEVSHRQDEVAKLTKSFSGMVSALKDRDKIRGVLNKVVSKEISEEILKRNLDFTGEEKVLTLLFSDIRGFTKMSEGIPPQTLITMLNIYMTRMCRIIDATHGVVDKFVGDEIMTLYGAPLSLEFHAVKAIEAALLMMQDLRLWNEERKKQKLLTFEIGIGIHTGLVYTGNMGAENRLNYTAIGANVNLASRICSIAKPMQIVITEQTFLSQGVQGKFECKKLDPVSLKGIEEPVQIFEVIGVKKKA